MSFYSQYPASSGGSGTNPSIGSNGSPAPSSSTAVAAVNPMGNLQPLKTDIIGSLLVDAKGIFTIQGPGNPANPPTYWPYTTPIVVGTYTELIASTVSTSNYIDIFDSSGQAMILATGAVGSEVPLAYIPPGGDQFYVQIPAGTRISYAALTANAVAGYLLLNLWM